jgi:hypothetical protein
MTRGGTLSRAHARRIPRTATAPDLSNFMWDIAGAGLIEIPPESNVIPFPTTATVLPRRAPPAYSMTTSRGGWEFEPPPTARIPPQFISASFVSSKTVTLRPNSFPSAFASSASRWGEAVSAGRFAISRVQTTFSAIVCCSSRAFRRSVSSRPSSSPSAIVISSTMPSVFDLYFRNS